MDTTTTTTSSLTLTELSKRRSKILIVDDEPDISYTPKNVLEQQLVQERTAYEVTIFNDPVIALSNFKPGLYALLLLDFKMPKIDGYELYDRIKKSR